jgi:hypothetical protein
MEKRADAYYPVKGVNFANRRVYRVNLSVWIGPAHRDLKHLPLEQSARTFSGWLGVSIAAPLGR